MKIESHGGVSRVFVGGCELLRHTSETPLLEIGRSDFHFETTQSGMHRIHNRVSDWLTLRGCEVSGDSLRLFEGEIEVRLDFEPCKGGFTFRVSLPEGYNYARMRLPATRSEAVYGGGVQFGTLNLRGKKYPIWTSEMGLGRHPLRPYTWLANMIAGAGGAYWNTYFPEAAFLSSRGYGCLIDTHAYCLLDFSHSHCHIVEVPADCEITVFAGAGLKDLAGKLAQKLGIMPEPPEWVFKGGILGIQGGLPFVSERVDQVVSAGAKLSGIWTQDWSGVRILWQGKRLFWNWTVDRQLYPGLELEIKRRAGEGIRWLTYLNPYFNLEGEQYQSARKNGFLVKDEHGEVLVHQVAGFQAGILDLTHPSAWEWYKDTIIQQNVLALGVRGWMADYGEDISEKARFWDGRTGREVHNQYPLLWAQLNRQAVEEAGLQSEVLIFHRSGYHRATQFMNMNWGGDQVVYWNQHDGFPAGVTGGLSGSLSGVQYYHTDAGGYFSFRWIKRTKEVLFRWSEANAFSPVLRTHEGNRPWAGPQPWQDEETLHHFARMTRLRAALSPYLKAVSLEAQQTGLGMMRPFCLENSDPRWKNKRNAYYLGRDLLVYPVMRPGVKSMRIDIPEGEWTHLWSGRAYGAGSFRVECPIGYPVILFRSGSIHEPVFESVRREGTEKR